MLFANTSAEHPDTYTFAARVCDELEATHQLACLWYEFCTVETASRGRYIRSATYRLVNRKPFDPQANPDGYRSDGSAFEEMVSVSRLPSRFRRNCTSMLKMRPGLDLLAEWLGGGPGPRRRGHYHGLTLLTARQWARRYRGVKLSTKQKLERVAFATSRPVYRAAQRWADFTVAPDTQGSDPEVPPARPPTFGA